MKYVTRLLVLVVLMAGAMLLAVSQPAHATQVWTCDTVEFLPGNAGIGATNCTGGGPGPDGVIHGRIIGTVVLLCTSVDGTLAPLEVTGTGCRAL